MTLRRSTRVLLIAAVSAASGVKASGFVNALPDVRLELIRETMYTTEADYPPESLRAGQQGLVKVMITVNPEGRVTACSVYRSSGARPLDERSCALAFERFRFRPARRDGIAVEDQAILPVDWRLED